MPKKNGPTPGPQDRDKAISVAYLRLTGALQTEAAESVGISADTISRWEHSPWWPEILAEASKRWLSGLEARARLVLQTGMDASLALKILERRLPELAPATQNMNLNTPNLPTRIILETVAPPRDDDRDGTPPDPDS